MDELVGGRVSRDLYEKLSKRYVEQRRASEARLAQLEVDYRDPLDFLDKCLVVASTFQYLHQRFTPPQQKMLLRAIFNRIVVHERAIVNATLNPPFSFLMGEEVSRVFKDPPSARTWKEIFEQLVVYTMSPDYGRMNTLLKSVIEENKEGEETVQATLQRSDSAAGA